MVPCEVEVMHAFGRTRFQNAFMCEHDVDGVMVQSVHGSWLALCEHDFVAQDACWGYVSALSGGPRARNCAQHTSGDPAGTSTAGSVPCVGISDRQPITGKLPLVALPRRLLTGRPQRQVHPGIPVVEQATVEATVAGRLGPWHPLPGAI